MMGAPGELFKEFVQTVRLKVLHRGVESKC